jgi:hypothetical protein
MRFYHGNIVAADKVSCLRCGGSMFTLTHWKVGTNEAGSLQGGIHSWSTRERALIYQTLLFVVGCDIMYSKVDVSVDGLPPPNGIVLSLSCRDTGQASLGCTEDKGSTPK